MSVHTCCISLQLLTSLCTLSLDPSSDSSILVQSSVRIPGNQQLCVLGRIECIYAYKGYKKKHFFQGKVNSSYHYASFPARAGFKPEDFHTGLDRDCRRLWSCAMARPIRLPGISQRHLFLFCTEARCRTLPNPVESCVSCAVYITGPTVANSAANRLAEEETCHCKYVPQYTRVGAWATLLLGWDVHVRTQPFIRYLVCTFLSAAL